MPVSTCAKQGVVKMGSKKTGKRAAEEENPRRGLRGAQTGPQWKEAEKTHTVEEIYLSANVARLRDDRF